MTIAQITAILYLLVAFGVPQPTVDTVQTILLSANKTAYTIPMSEQTSTPAVGTSATPAPECTDTPSLELRQGIGVSKSDSKSTVDFGSIYAYSKCADQKFVLNFKAPADWKSADYSFDRKDIPMKEQGVVDFGTYKDLHSYVVGLNDTIRFSTSKSGAFDASIEVLNTVTGATTTLPVKFTL